MERIAKRINKRPADTVQRLEKDKGKILVWETEEIDETPKKEEKEDPIRSEHLIKLIILFRLFVWDNFTRLCIQNRYVELPSLLL